MASTTKRPKKSSEVLKKRPPARTPEAQERRLIGLAYDLAEEQFLNGTVTSQVHTHFLKLATAREKLEQEILRQDVKLKQAKTESIEAAKETAELYRNALNAMRAYNGDGELTDDD